MSRFPAWILLTPVEAVSVNHAKVAPMSIAAHIRIARALVINARLVDLLLVIIVFPPYRIFSMAICKHGFAVITPKQSKDTSITYAL
jgi:hypothetical protein